MDILQPDELFSVADFTALAGALEREISGRGHLPILVGGTGLYVQSFLYGVRFAAEKTPDGLREQLAAELNEKGPEAMYAELQAVDLEAAAAIHPNNHVRVLRALEHYRATGKKLSEQKADSLPPEKPYRSLILGLDFPERAQLYRRIDLRVDQMMEQGLLEEVRALQAMGYHRGMVSMQGLGYKELLAYLDGECSLEEAIAVIKRDTRHFAKRQITWFKREKDVIWLNKQEFGYQEDAILEEILNRWAEKTRS